MTKQYVQTEGEQKLLRDVMGNNVDAATQRLAVQSEKIKNDLQKKETSE